MYYFCTAISNRNLQLFHSGLFGAASAMPSKLEHCRVATKSRKILEQNFAEIAQLVEHDLAKVGVASSSLVFRSKRLAAMRGVFVCGWALCVGGGRMDNFSTHCISAAYKRACANPLVI